MRIEGSCRQIPVAPVLLWTSIIILSFISGIHSMSADRLRQGRRATDIQPYSAIDLQTLNFLREFIEGRYVPPQQQQPSPTEMSTDEEDEIESTADYERIPLSLIIQAILNSYFEDSREEKRAGPVGACHFKVCNMGRKRKFVKRVKHR